MRYLLIFVTCLFVACQAEPEPKLQTGRWTGTLTPMNHPDIHNPIEYVVSYRKDNLILSIIGPDSVLVPTREERVEGDSLFFSFSEPEQKVLLKCAFGKKKIGRICRPMHRYIGKMGTVYDDTSRPIKPVYITVNPNQYGGRPVNNSFEHS